MLIPQQGVVQPMVMSQGVQPGVLNLGQFMGLFFTLFLFPEGGMVGKRAVKSRY